MYCKFEISFDSISYFYLCMSRNTTSRVQINKVVHLLSINCNTAKYVHVAVNLRFSLGSIRSVYLLFIYFRYTETYVHIAVNLKFPLIQKSFIFYILTAVHLHITYYHMVRSNYMI